MNVAWTYLGERPYSEVWDQQEDLRNKILDHNYAGQLLLVEHPPTITLGRAEKGTNLLFNRKTLNQQGFDVIETNRGGKITYHGPGQLVAYPVFNLRSFRMGVKEFVCALERTMIQCLAQVGIQACRKEGSPGAWVGERKIGSIGIHVRKQVSIHGLALNICPDLSHFALIHPCGIANLQMTSVKQEGHQTSVEEFLPIFLHSFSKVFNCDMEPTPIGKGRNHHSLKEQNSVCHV